MWDKFLNNNRLKQLKAKEEQLKAKEEQLDEYLKNVKSAIDECKIGSEQPKSKKEELEYLVKLEDASTKTDHTLTWMMDCNLKTIMNEVEKYNIILDEIEERRKLKTYEEL